MKDRDIRNGLARAHAVNGVYAQVKHIRSGSLSGGWQYRKFRPGYMFRGQPWLYAGPTKDVVRFLS